MSLSPSELARDAQPAQPSHHTQIAQLLNLSADDVIHGSKAFQELEASQSSWPAQIYHRSSYQARQLSLDRAAILLDRDPSQVYRIYLNYRRNQRRQRLFRDLSRPQGDLESEALASPLNHQ